MLLACYSSGTRAREFQKKPLAEQIEAASAIVGRVHPGPGNSLTNPIVVNWNKIPFSLGPWPAWNGVREGPGQDGHIDTPGYRLLSTPAGRTMFAGAALRQTPDWQEGAVQSAHSAVANLADQHRVRKASSPRAA